MIGIALAIAIFDICLIRKKGKYESISAHFIRFYKPNKIMFFVLIGVGLVLGHLTWSMSTFDYLSKEEIIQKCKEVMQ